MEAEHFSKADRHIAVTGRKVKIELKGVYAAMMPTQAVGHTAAHVTGQSPEIRIPQRARMEFASSTFSAKTRPQTAERPQATCSAVSCRDDRSCSAIVLVAARSDRRSAAETS